MKDDPKSNPEFGSELLSGDGKWWEFLDPNTYEVKSNLPGAMKATSSLVDWSKKSKPRSGPIGFGFYNRCGSCALPCPPDHTFCVHCGGEPKAPEVVNTYAVVIKKLDSEESREAAAELISRAGYNLDFKEVHKMLGMLPAIFTVRERKSRVAASLAKMAEVGIYGKSFSVEDTSVPWLSETVESILRHPRQAMIFAAILGITVALAVVWSPLVVFLGLAAGGFLFQRQLDHYQHQGQYEMRPNAVLDQLSGFEEIRDTSVDLLKRIKDKEFKGSLTMCLMEYYTLHQQFSSYEAEYGEVLLRSDHALRELVEQVVRIGVRFADLEFLINSTEPAELRQRIASAQSRLQSGTSEDADFTSKSIEFLEKELAQHKELVKLKAQFKSRLRAIAMSMESLRDRVATLQQAKTIAWEEIPMESILKELDQELEIFEETVEALA